jgi:putative phosphoribosyl transferase
MPILYKNRTDAGKKLAAKLEKYKNKNVIVFAIPRGGVPVGYEVAKFLEAPLDVIVARKLHIPWNPEAGFGALAPDGTTILNEEMVIDLAIDEKTIQKIKKEVFEEIKRREKIYRGTKPFPQVKEKIVILIDDGLASGYTMLAAIKYLKNLKPAKIVVAVPTASESAYNEVKKVADEVVSLYVQKGYPYAVASFYQDWYDLSDEEVMNYL